MRGRGRGRAGFTRSRDESGRGGGGFGRGRDRSGPSEDNTPKPLPVGPAPDYHFDVRRAIASAISNEAFLTAQREIVGDDPASLMDVNSVLEQVCDVCDKHVTSLPTATPIDFASLRLDVENVVGGFPSCHNSAAATSSFADGFMSRIEGRLTKRAPPQKPVDAAPDRKHKRVENSNNNGAVLGDQPPISIPLPRSHQPQYGMPSPPSGGLLGNAPTTTHHQHNSMYPNNMHMQSPYGHHQHHMANVFNPPAPPVPEPAPDLGTRYLTLRPLPPAIQNVSALRTALAELTRDTIHGQRISYLNVEVFKESQLQSEEATTVEPTADDAKFFAVASFTTIDGASAVAHRINSMSDRDNTPVRGAGATLDEIMLIWGSKREALEALEEELGNELDNYPNTRPAALYAALDTLKAQKMEGMQRVADMKKTAATLEDKEAIKEVLKGVLAINGQIDAISQRLGNEFRLNPNAPAEERQIPPERFSTSPAQPTSMGQLIFISGASAPMPDDMVLLLLRKLNITPSHIWRDPASTTISVEVESAGVAFGILRHLDFIDHSICGLEVSKKRPRVEQQQPQQQPQQQQQQQQQQPEQQPVPDQQIEQQPLEQQPEQVEQQPEEPVAQ